MGDVNPGISALPAPVALYTPKGRITSVEPSAGCERQVAELCGPKGSQTRSVLCNGLVFTEKWRLGPQPAGGPIPLSRKQLFAGQS